MTWALPFRRSSTSPINRSSRSRIRVVVSFIRFVYSSTPKRSWAFFMISFCGSWDFAVGKAWGVGVAALLQYRDLAGAVHDRQFIGEAFFLSHRDHALFVFFLCFFYQLNSLPEGYMALISGSKDAIQKS